MAEINEVSVRRLLLNKLVSIPNLPEIALDSEEYTPNVKVAYMQEKDIPATTQAYTLDASGFQRREGMYRIWILHPKGTNVFNIMTDVDKVKSGFSRGTFLNESGTKVEIQKTDVGSTFEYQEMTAIQMLVRYSVLSA